MNTPVELRSATLADLPALEELSGKCDSAPRWSTLLWRQTLESSQSASPRRLVLLAMQNHSLTGFVVLHTAADEGELESIAVTPSARRGGVGRALCESLWPRAIAAGLQMIYLEVRESNAAALAFYRALGFVLQGKRPQYYTAPAEGAFVLAKNLGRSSGCDV